MAIEVIRAESREEWLEKRGAVNRIGGSECAAVLGLNPWMTNVDLWEIKTGRKQKHDVSDLAAVSYGRAAEEHLRELFKLDWPEMFVDYSPNTFILNSEYPFALASVDGLLTDKEGRLGILEIKTASIRGESQKKKWDGRVPQNYYTQVLQYMAVLEADFAVIVAQLSYGTGDDLLKVTKHYKIEREDVQDDIDALMDAERDFWTYVEKDERPPLILPEI